MNIDPVYMTRKRFADFMVMRLYKLGTIPILMHEDDDWRDWAMRLQSVPQIAAFNPPDPRMFETFVEWARRFNLVVVV